MLKITLVFAVIVAVAYGKPGLLHSGFVAPIAAIPSAVSHSSRVDIHSSPLVVAHAAPAVAIAAAPIAHYALPAATSYSSRYDIHSAPLIATLGHSIHGW